MSRRRNRLILALWLACLAVCGWFLFVRTELVFDLTRFLPRDDPAVSLLEELRASQSARLILIGIGGGSEPERAAASIALAQRLRGSGLFSRVENGSDALRAAEAMALFSHRYLLSPTVTADRFSEAGLRQALKERLADLRSPASIVEKRLLPQDPTGELQSLLRLWLADRRQPASRMGLWFSEDGGRAVLLAETRAAGFDAEGQRAAVAAVQEGFRAVQGESGLMLQLGGPPVLTIFSQDRVRSEVEWLGTVASGLIVLLLAAAYRSWRAVGLSVLPLLSAILVGGAVTGATFGHVHGITLGFAITLLGVADDYPIMLMTFVRGDTPVSHRLNQIAPLQWLCVTLTAIGYLSLITPSFPALSQLGVFSAVGLVAAMITTRFVLPALLPERWAMPGGSGTWPWLRRLALQPRWRLSRRAALGLASLITAVLITWPPAWEDDLAAISPLPRAMLATDQQLRQALGAPDAGHVVILHGADREEVLRKSERVAALLEELIIRGALQGFTAPSQYLPSAAVQTRRQAALPPPETLRAALNAAAAGLPFQPGLFEPFLADVERARTGPLVSLDDLAATPVGSVLGSLLFPRPGGWTGLISLSGVAQADAIAAAVDALRLDGVRSLAVRQETNRVLNDFRDGALGRLAAGGAAIVIILAVGLRSWHRLVAVLLPLGLALLIDLLVLTALGQRINLFHVVSCLLVTGIAIDYAIFFSQPGQDADYSARALQAMTLCCATTLLSFGLLAFSSLPVLQAIGSTAAIGVAATFILSFLLARPAPGRGGQARPSVAEDDDERGAKPAGSE